MKKLFALLTICLLFACGGGDEKKKVKQEISGCTDPDAENFYSKATQDDGTCISFVGEWDVFYDDEFKEKITFYSDKTARTTANERLASWRLTKDNLMCLGPNVNSEKDDGSECFEYQWIDSNTWKINAPTGRGLAIFRRVK